MALKIHFSEYVPTNHTAPDELDTKSFDQKQDDGTKVKMSYYELPFKYNFGNNMINHFQFKGPRETAIVALFWDGKPSFKLEFNPDIPEHQAFLDFIDGPMRVRSAELIVSNKAKLPPALHETMSIFEAQGALVVGVILKGKVKDNKYDANVKNISAKGLGYTPREDDPVKNRRAGVPELWTKVRFAQGGEGKSIPTPILSQQGNVFIGTPLFKLSHAYINGNGASVQLQLVDFIVTSPIEKREFADSMKEEIQEAEAGNPDLARSLEAQIALLTGNLPPQVPQATTTTTTTSNQEQGGNGGGNGAGAGLDNGSSNAVETISVGRPDTNTSQSPDLTGGIAAALAAAQNDSNINPVSTETFHNTDPGFNPEAGMTSVSGETTTASFSEFVGNGASMMTSNVPAPTPAPAPAPQVQTQVQPQPQPQYTQPIQGQTQQSQMQPVQGQPQMQLVQGQGYTQPIQGQPQPQYTQPIQGQPQMQPVQGQGYNQPIQGQGQPQYTQPQQPYQQPMQ